MVVLSGRERERRDFPSAASPKVEKSRPQSPPTCGVGAGRTWEFPAAKSKKVDSSRPRHVPPAVPFGGLARRSSSSAVPPRWVRPLKLSLSGPPQWVPGISPRPSQKAGSSRPRHMGSPPTAESGIDPRRTGTHYPFPPRVRVEEAIVFGRPGRVVAAPGAVGNFRVAKWNKNQLSPENQLHTVMVPAHDQVEKSIAHIIVSAHSQVRNNQSIPVAPSGAGRVGGFPSGQVEKSIPVAPDGLAGKLWRGATNSPGTCETNRPLCEREPIF